MSETWGNTMRLTTCLLALLFAMSANAANISFSGPNFDDTGGSYTTSQRVQGQLNTSGTLPGGLNSANIAGQVISYSFTDGSQTLTQSNSQIIAALISTNTTGAVTGLVLTIWSESGEITKGVGGNNINGIDISQGQQVNFSAGYQGAPCASIQSCVGFAVSDAANYGISNSVGTVLGTATVVRVPVNNPIALLILSVLVALAAGASIRRRSNG